VFLVKPILSRHFRIFWPLFPLRLLLLLLFLYLFPCYENCLRFLKLHNLHNRRPYLDALFFISVYSVSNCWPSLSDITGIRILPRNFRNSFLFSDTSKNSPSARCVSAANHLCKDVDILRKTTGSFNQILRQSVTCLYILINVFWGGFRAFVLVLFYNALYYYIVFVLFVWCFLCICIVLVLYLWLCTGFIIGTYGVKPARWYIPTELNCIIDVVKHPDTHSVRYINHLKPTGYVMHQPV
jgi:hypothetical protein